MGKEKMYASFCPSCGIEKFGRKRDIAKQCKPCNMRSIEAAYRYVKTKETKVSPAEHCAKYREAHKLDTSFRLNKLLQQAKVRAKKRGLPCTIDLAYLIKEFPIDSKCPVFGTDLFWGISGKGDRNNSPSLDRLNPELGYTIDNVRIISWKANRIKSDANIKDIEAVLKYMKS